MTHQMQMSVGEIQRVGVWALRSLGSAYGVADRSAPLLALSQAYGADVLRFIRVDEDRIRDGFAQPRVSRQKTEVGYEIEAHGRSLIEHGPPAVDLACCEARRSSYGSVVIRQSIGSCLISALSAIATQRGLSLLTIHAADSRESVFPGPGSSGWTLWTRLGPATQGFSGRPDSATDVLAFASAIALGLAESVAASFQQARDARAGGEALTTFIALDLSASAVRASANAGVSAPLRSYATDEPQRLTTALRRGMTVEIEDFLNLYRLERLAWAPSSDRSRAQAAF